MTIGCARCWSVRIGVALAILASACRAGTQRPSDQSGTRRRGAGAPPQSQLADSDWAGNPVTRVEELFAGRFPGVRVLYTPGQGIAVRVRGATSITGSNDPLYVVDGFPMEPGPGGLLSINPYDIAGIEVLKDAGSIAEYGMRGANGVVLIKTKRTR
jgi:TonB-dependent starch-binding outer membrane protein SusC